MLRLLYPTCACSRRNYITHISVHKQIENRYTACLFVYLSVTFMHCAQTAENIDTISLYTTTTAPCLSQQIVLKFRLHRSTHPPPKKKVCH